MKKFKIIIVGAGPAGIGNAVALKHLGLEKSDFIVLEKEKVGASFRKWPKEMKFITPSFTGNQFGMVDLNAITTNTSPAFTLSKEHMTGKEYAFYLEAISDFFDVPLKKNVEVNSVTKNGECFELETSKGTYVSDFLIWCAGEFQYPDLSPFEGAELCTHNTHIKSYEKVKGRDQIVIGGYESGIDAAVNFSQLDKRVIVLDGGCPWKETSSDPSTVLSTYTFERLQDEKPKGNIKLVKKFQVKEVLKHKDGYEVVSEAGKRITCPNAPILCTGFSGSTGIIESLIDRNEHGHIGLTASDESTLTENLFLSGPMVRHNKAIFCFIYKFRQRFPVIAKEIAARLELDTEGLDIYKKANMYLEDLSCCDEECAC